MNKKELFDLILSWENLPLLLHKLVNQPDDLEQLMELALYSSHPKSWRAAYLAEKVHDEKPELLIPYLEAIIRRLKTETNSSKKRHYLKLISLNKIPEKHRPFLIDHCLDCFTSAHEPVAVRVHAMQVLFNISETEPSFKPELLSIIEHEMELHPTPGILSRGKKLAGILAGKTRISRA